MSATKEVLERILKDEAFVMACRIQIPESEPEDKDEIFALMAKVAGGTDVTDQELTQWGFKDVKDAKTKFDNIAGITLNVYNCLIMGASHVLEFGTVEELTVAELEEMVDEL